jgi:hypothetical protein
MSPFILRLGYQAHRPHRVRQPVLVKTSFTRSIGNGAAHVRYIAFRTQEAAGERAQVFDRINNHARVQPFLDRLRTDPVIQPERRAVVHKLIISMRGRDYRDAGVDYIDLVRHTMARLEHQVGGRLDWIAAVHLKEQTPHVHVAIRASYTDRATGQLLPLRIDRDLLAALKADTTRSVERLLTPVLEQRRREWLIEHQRLRLFANFRAWLEHWREREERDRLQEEIEERRRQIREEEERA